MFGNAAAPPTGGLFGGTSTSNNPSSGANNNASSSGGLFGGFNSSHNFVIKASGRAEIPFPAERAVINVLVSSTGTNKAAVSDEVLTTAKHLETLLKDLSPKDDSAASKAAAALAHWSKTNLTSTSYVPRTVDATQPPWPREYTATIKFDIRFKEFKSMGAFGSRLTALEHVEVQSISWILTDATEKSHRSEMRKLAAQDALQKAQDYCEVLGCTNIRPVELNEGAHNFTPGRSLFGSSNIVPTSYQTMQSAPGYQPQAMGMMMPQQAAGMQRRVEGELEFRPQEVRMTTEVSVRFHATFVQPETMPLLR